MKTNEVAKLLGIRKSHLRFLRSKGLVSPRIDNDGHQEFSEQDITRIKLLLVFRKAGVPIRLLQKLTQEKITAAEALAETGELLEKESGKLHESMELCRKLNRLDFDAIQTDDLWQMISGETLTEADE